MNYDGINIDDQNYLIEKAKSKKDGVYSAKGVVYRVVKNRVKYIALSNKVILQCFGSFNCIIGKLGPYEDRAKGLKQIKEK